MNWTEIIEKGIIGGASGLMVYVFVKIIDFFRNKHISIDHQGIRKDYEKLASTIRLPKIKIPYVKLESKTNEQKTPSTKRNESEQNGLNQNERIVRTYYDLNQKSSLGLTFILTALGAFGLMIYFLSRLAS